jgi:hypothetical protein
MDVESVFGGRRIQLNGRIVLKILTLLRFAPTVELILKKGFNYKKPYEEENKNIYSSISTLQKWNYKLE